MNEWMNTVELDILEEQKKKNENFTGLRKLEPGVEGVLLAKDAPAASVENVADLRERLVK